MVYNLPILRKTSISLIEEFTVGPKRSEQYCSNGLFLCDSDIKTCFIEFCAKMRFNGMQYACVKKKFNLVDSEHMQNWPSWVVP